MSTPREVSLRAIIDRLDDAGLLEGRQPAIDLTVRGIADDSRRVEPGNVFCAWRGTARDSHEFIPLAERAGAVAIIAERSDPGDPTPRIVVRDGRRAAALAASLVYGDPQDELILVGITGTNGKTTTAWLVRHVLSARWPSASLGTLGAVLERGQIVSSAETLTTPGPVELAATLRALVNRGIRALAMEASSHALHQGRMHGLRFHAGVFTNLSRDHLDYHGTVDAYLDAKLQLEDLIREDGWAIANADDRAWDALGAKGARLLRFGIHHDANVTARELEIDGRGARFRLETPVGPVPVTLPLLGAYNVSNALAAAAVAAAFELPPDEIAHQLASTPQVPGRLERLTAIPCPVLRDYAHTPDALERALATLRPLTDGRLIVVFGAGGDRDRGKRPLMGSAAQEGADVVIVTSDNPRTEDPDAIIDDIVAGMREGYLRITDRREAIAAALDMATADDIILLAGKGHETYQVIGTEKVPFDEAAIVHELLETANGAAR
ncbi:MAG: UDP-N-acetylmuramoyl-L-alanyl-D-glutamate--2,6-diaminopimelate ligase [Candidatus Cloacimonetes bacterium]|nr:UDP-N-acetylmuramoyl-L-alanyl-D-glutamate--2,6-diaminopimelate ligase [Candidatus Cloacimonadota bacterium]